jgi:hypothetical protein
MCSQKPDGTSTRACQTHFYSYYTESGGRKLFRLLVNVPKHLVWNDREITNNPSFLENKKPRLHPTDMGFVAGFLLGNSPASEFYMPTFRNTLSVPSS